ncbi:MAG: outer membrane beta-barrel protein [Ignavibacteria bacterium]|nr:outer membrane beta-barrel protein [Ignavibacteria bacterium]
MKAKLLIYTLIFILTLCYTAGNSQEKIKDKPEKSQEEKPELNRIKSGATHDSITVNEESNQEEPFAFGDFTWLNGNDRRHKQLLDTKYFTGSFMLDMNYSYSNHHPVDNTVVGSTALARNNEFQVSFAGIGGDFHYNNVRGRIMLQLGTRSTVVPRNDFSTTRGQFDLGNAYRYISEAYAGYHFDVWNGINLDAGLFMSYVGLFSYYNSENWAYQPSFTSDNTPWFFNGLRLQTFPSNKLKLELWVINGWQSYGKFNDFPGLGLQVLYRPKENISMLSNTYFGTDTQNKSDRVRFHSDNSIEYRYYNRPGKFLHRAAFSVTGDLGFENGAGVSPFGGNGVPAQNFISGMVYNRIWMANDHLGWTFGGGFIHNPGRYLVLLPTGAAGQIFDTSPGTKFDGWDVSTTFDWMPDENITWRLEFVHRESNVPYFAGHGGVTAPDGLNTTQIPAGWMPDQVKAESRLIFAVLCRF